MKTLINSENMLGIVGKGKARQHSELKRYFGKCPEKTILNNEFNCAPTCIQTKGYKLDSNQKQQGLSLW